MRNLLEVISKSFGGRVETEFPKRPRLDYRIDGVEDKSVW